MLAALTDTTKLTESTDTTLVVPIHTEPRRDTRTVIVSITNGESVSWSWHRSLVDLLARDGRGRRHVVDVTGIQAGVGMVGHARNSAVAQWLEGDAPWLLWVDTDMGFRPSVLDRLLASADPDTRPVVGALCFAQQRHESDGMGGYRPALWPTAFEEEVEGTSREVGYWPILDYRMNSLIEVAATGSAMLLVHRSAYQKTADWYDPMRGPNGKWLSEDLAFCRRLGEAGVPIHVHTGIHTSHHKPVWATEADYIGQRILSTIGAQGGTQANR